MNEPRKRGGQRRYDESSCGFDVAAFRAWLLARGDAERGFRGYQPSTVRCLIETAMRLERYARTRDPSTWPRNPQTHQTVGRLLAWADAGGVLPAEFRAVLEAFMAQWRGPARRRQPERSIDDAKWNELFDRCVARPGAEPLVLRLMMATGMRVGDVLRVTRGPVLTGLSNTEGLIDLTTKGGKASVQGVAVAPDEWRALGAMFEASPAAQNVAELVAPGRPETNGAAYVRVRSELLAVAKLAGVEGHVHLHRLRRTMAIRALRETKDITLVARLLGHKSINTTGRYTDEARTDDVIELAKAIAPRRKK